MSEWFEKSFGEDYELVYKHRDKEGAKQEIGNMMDWLGLEPGAKVLDLCCGNGRHAQALLEAGYQVTGVDLSEVLLEEAQANDPGKRITWIRADMRKLPLPGQQFDAVVNLFTSFGYFKTDAEHQQVLLEVARVLKPGGKFVIDFLNPEYTEDHLVADSERTDEGQLIQEHRKVEDGYVMKEIEISDLQQPDEEPRCYTERIKCYSLADFRSMLLRAGLMLEEVHGKYKEEDSRYDHERSPRMIMVGQKTG